MGEHLCDLEVGKNVFNKSKTPVTIKENNCKVDYIKTETLYPSNDIMKKPKMLCHMHLTQDSHPGHSLTFFSTDK